MSDGLALVLAVFGGFACLALFAGIVLVAARTRALRDEEQPFIPTAANHNEV